MNQTLNPKANRRDGEFTGKFGPIDLRALEDWNKKNTLARLAYRYLPTMYNDNEEKVHLNWPY